MESRRVPYEPEQSVGGSRLMFQQLMAQLDPRLLDDTAIVLCTPQGAPAARRRAVLWQHLDVDQASVAFLQDRNVHAGFDRFVFVSHWQARRYVRTFGVPPERSIVLRNAIHPFPAHSKPATGRVKVAYTSTPWRGLDVLLDAWDQLDPEDAELHVFSSCKLYGRRFGRHDARFAALYAKAEDLESVHYHGIVPNERLREELLTTHVLAYPSTFAETSCISVIEALAAGCRVVTSGHGALPETCAGFARMYPYVADRAAHAKRFASELEDTIVAAAASPTDPLQVTYFDQHYTWPTRLPEWERLLLELSRT
jgi:glycosyltransferase involved in cell wall biosynthesis